MPIRQITIVGTGLIGGSLGLALRQVGFAGKIVGCDKRARPRDRRKRAAPSIARRPICERASRWQRRVVLATPVGCILSQLESIAPLLPPTTLITDAGSTKQRFVERARELFGAQAAQRVLPGHPMAGKEYGGIEHADANLFRDAVWLITPIDCAETLHCRAAGISTDCCGRSALASWPWMPSGTTVSAPGSATCRR